MRCRTTMIIKYCYIPILLALASYQSIAFSDIDGIVISLKADNLAVVSAGEKIYQIQCASCHGANLEGQPNWRTRDDNGFLPAPPHDATGHTWHHADDLLFEITKYGPNAIISDKEYKTVMPAYENVLSDEEIVAVLSFIKNSWPEEQRSWQEEVNGTVKEGINFKPKSDSSLLEKILKK